MVTKLKYDRYIQVKWYCISMYSIYSEGYNYQFHFKPEVQYYNH